VRIRAAQTVVPVAVADAEAGWVERARRETVRALERAVREARGAVDDDEEWVRFRVALSPSDRAVVEEALELAGRLLPTSKRPQRLEAMAQEFLGTFPLEAGDDGARSAGAALRTDEARARREIREARLEAETEGWAFLASRCATRSTRATRRRCVRRGRSAHGCPRGSPSCSRQRSGRSGRLRAASLPTARASSGWRGTSSRRGGRT
jgi:hypothetical protein